MDVQRIEAVVKTDVITSRKFCGVFAEDTLPRKIHSYPCGYIVNTDPISKPGKHWVAFYFQSSHEGEFFDSYGRAPVNYSRQFVNFLNRNSSAWNSNHKELQSLFSTVCGEYCIFYLMHRSRGVSMNTIVNLFSSDKHLNDEKVYGFIAKYFV